MRPLLPELLAQTPKILAECAIAERLRRIPDIVLHPTLFNTPLIYGPDFARQAMAGLYEEYITTAMTAGLPLLLTAPTWRLDPQRTADAGFPLSINADAVSFLLRIRTGMDAPTAPVWVGALVGPQNDCYRPEQAPARLAAEIFHRPQIELLASTAVDFLLAQTLPSVREAQGIARVMARTDKPYLISFCTGPDGRVLDGMSLPEAFAVIDDDPQLARPPAGYFVNCTHPQFILDAYEPGVLDRLVGMQANGSSKDVTALDGSGETVADPLADWAAAMLELHRTHQVAVLGGCCGTALLHLQALAR